MSSLYNILIALSCSLFILSLRDLLQNIQARGQYANCDSKNDFINILSLEKLKTLDSLDIAVKVSLHEYQISNWNQ